MTTGKVYSPSPASRSEWCKGKTLEESLTHMVVEANSISSEKDVYFPTPFKARTCTYLYGSVHSTIKCAKFETVIVLIAANGMEYSRYRFRPDTHAYPT